MRAFGQNPTEQDLQELKVIIENDGNPKINFPYFLSLTATKMQDKDAEQQLINAFNVFDNNRDGSIATENFRDIINNLGEKLTQSEIREILKEADLDGDGNIDYMEFVKMMMSK